MGTIYFVLLVVVCFSGTLLVLKRINSKSYYTRVRNAVDHDELKAARLKKNAENPKFSAYVDWYTKKFGDDSGGPREVFVGTAHVVNDSNGAVAGARKRAVS